MNVNIQGLLPKESCHFRDEESSGQCCKKDLPRLSSNNSKATQDSQQEVAIQANDFEIERASSYLPARKRYLPVKFSDYRITCEINESEISQRELDINDKVDSSYRTRKSNFTKVQERPRPRGRPVKQCSMLETGKTSEETKQINQADQHEINEKEALVKVADGFKCKLCGHIFTLRGNAKSHLITHTERRPFPCDYEGCGKQLRSKESLRRHQLSHLGIKNFECTMCNKKLSTLNSLQEHMTVHSGDKPLVCSVCGRQFRQKAVLKRHIVTHSQDKPFNCKICGKSFSMKVYVQSHMKTHTGERPFPCDVCNKSFAHASDLKRHKIIHTGTKPYACSVCPMRFNDGSSRKRHEREHQTAQQLSCVLCGQQFSRSVHLRSHMSRSHPDQAQGLYIIQSNGMNLKAPKQTTYSSLLPISQSKHHSALFVADSTEKPEQTVNGLAADNIKLLAQTADDGGNNQRLNLTPTANVGTDRNESEVEPSIEVSVLDPHIPERLDTLQPGYTYKIIDHQNSSNILEFRLEGGEDVGNIDMPGITEIIDGIARGTQGEGKFTIVKDEGSVNTFMVIEQAESDSVFQQQQTPLTENRTESEVPLCKSLPPQEGVDVLPKSSSANVSASLVTETTDANATQENKGANILPQHTAPAIRNAIFQITVSNDTMHEAGDIKPLKSDLTNCIIEELTNTESNLDVKKQKTGLIDKESLAYIVHPDFSSQDYYNWLSAFMVKCKQLTLPLDKETFQNISHLHKTLSDFMAFPSGVIIDKNNFKVLMDIAKDLSHVTSNHITLMFDKLP